MGGEHWARPGGALSVLGLSMLLFGLSPLSAQSSNDTDRQLTANVVGAEVLPTAREAFMVPVGASEVRIDGRLDEAVWEAAIRIPISYEVDPAENGPAPVATECRLSHDAEHLYFACEARDPDPDGIRAYVVDRDGIDGHDRIVLTLDPFNDQRRAFQFGVSALGVQSDAVMAQQGAGNPNEGPNAMPVDDSWDAIWSSAGSITNDGYIVEAAIPFRSLRFPSGGGEWGAYITRWWPRSSNVEMRSSTWDRDDSCLLCQAQLLRGIRGGTPGVNVQLSPTLTGSRSDVRSDFGPAGQLVAGDSDPQFGMDAQWGLTSDLTLNLTANPDFSQVEADVAQLDVNNRFALFFPEKRPFFLEGADFFGTPINAVFTRSISDPIAGGKITGKIGDQAVGLLVGRDRANRIIIPGSEFSRTASLDSEVTTAVARFRRDVGGTSTVGALYTGREGTGYHNRLAGFDAFYRPLASVTIQGQLLRSQTEYPAAVAAEYDQSDRSFTGTGVQARGRWSTRNWRVEADFRRFDEGFRADAGFVTQAGIQGGFANMTRTWWGGSDRWFNQLRFTAGTWRNDDFSGNRINGGAWAGVEFEGPSQSFIGIWPNVAMSEYYDGVQHSGLNQLFFTMRAAPSGTLRFGLNGNVGDVVDYANGGVGSEFRLSPDASLRFGRNVEAGLSHTVQRLNRDGAPVFTANLSEVRAVYNFSPRSFLRSVIQYRHTDRDPAQYEAVVDPTRRSLFAQLLYAYKVNPQTLLFLGYSEDGTGFTDEDRRRVPLTTTGRSFFVKIGYAWRP